MSSISITVTFCTIITIYPSLLGLEEPMPLRDMNAGKQSADQQPRSTCSSCSPDINVRFGVSQSNLTRVSGARLSAEIGAAFLPSRRVAIRDARHAGGGPRAGPPPGRRDAT